MAVEDFTTYTEVDPNSHIDLVGTNHIDCTVRKNEDAYLYKDKGVGHFTDFEHLIDLKMNVVPAGSQAGCWALTNYVNDYRGLINAGKTAIVVLPVRKTAGPYWVYLIELYGGVEYFDYYEGSSGTWYYLKIKKDGRAFTCKIYSDSERTSLLGILSLILHGDWDFRYVFAVLSDNVNIDAGVDNDIENLDLQEAPPVGLPAPTKTLLTLTR